MTNTSIERMRPPWGTLLGLCLLAAPQLDAFEIETRWSRTAHSGANLRIGDPTIVTWGFVADDTPIVGDEGSTPSSLIAMFDGLYPGGGTGSDLTNREWFSYFEQSFDRWSQLSGLTYLYEPNDPGSPIDESTSPQGSVNTTPDVRIGAHLIDGSEGANTVAYSYYPNHADIVIDTANTAWFANRDDNSRRLRNTIIHEIGHGQGIAHVDLPQKAVMDDTIPTLIDGPQLDDILAVQRLYGDPLEKNGGNDTASLATPLGSLTTGATLTRGTLGDALLVTPGQVDFVSIDGSTDRDYYSFTVPAPALVSLELIPRGATYSIGGTSFNAKVLNDLDLALYDSDGSSQLALAASGGLGQVESLVDLFLPEAGTYFARVAGSIDQVQLYGLSVTATAVFLPGDVNLDGTVSTDDIAAFVAGWKTVLPTDDLVTAWRKGDLDLDGMSDLSDAFLLRNALAQAGLQFSFGQLTAVPEPASLALFSLGFAAGAIRCRRGLRRA